MIDTDKYEGHTPAPWRIEYGDMEQYGETDTVLSGIDVVALDVMRQDARLIADAPLILAAYDKQVRWINDILFRLERMDEASTGQRLRFLLTVQEELEMMIE